MGELLRLPKSLSSPSSLSSDAAKEYRVVLLGTHHKKPLFEKMCSVAEKFEQHFQYADIWYLTIRFKDDEEPVVLEMIDPGTEKTGERQMAIQQKSDAAILCYSAFNPNSFLALESVAEDFQTLNGKAPVTLLLCNEDQLAEEGFEEEHGKDTADDGYATNSGGGSPSDSEMASQTMPKRKSTTPAGRNLSMERIRETRESGQCPIGKEKAEQLCRSLGPNCEFHTFSFADQLADQFVLDLLAKLIRRVAEIRRQFRQNNRRNRMARPIASAQRRLSPSPLVHVLRRKTSIIRRKITPQIKGKQRERAKTTATGEEENQMKGEGQKTEAEPWQKQQKGAMDREGVQGCQLLLTAMAPKSSQESDPTASESVENENANGTTKSEQPFVTKHQRKHVVQGLGAVLKAVTHPRERVRVGASKGEKNAVRPTERKNSEGTAAEANPTKNTHFTREEEGKAAAEEQQQREKEQQQRKGSDRTRSSTCTIQ